MTEDSSIRMNLLIFISITTVVSARGMIQRHVACEIDAKEIAEIVLFDW